MSTYEERKERSKTSNIHFIRHEPQPIEQEDVNLTFPSTNLIFNFTYFSWIFFFHSFFLGGSFDVMALVVHAFRNNKPKTLN
jgi:hypothetical protein